MTLPQCRARAALMIAPAPTSGKGSGPDATDSLPRRRLHHNEWAAVSRDPTTARRHRSAWQAPDGLVRAAKILRRSVIFTFLRGRRRVRALRGARRLIPPVQCSSYARCVGMLPVCKDKDRGLLGPQRPNRRAGQGAELLVQAKATLAICSYERLSIELQIARVVRGQMAQSRLFPFPA